MNKENEIGHCPACHSEEIQYESIEIGCNEVYQECYCCKCGCEFEEHYAYSHQIITENPQKESNNK